MSDIEGGQVPNQQELQKNELTLESLGLTLDQVRDIILELELGASFDELYQDYKEMTDTPELTIEGFILDFLEEEGYQAEESDDISTFIEIGVRALCGNFL